MGKGWIITENVNKRLIFKRKNSIPRINTDIPEKDLIYIAGYLDGEGSFELAGKTKPTPIVRVSNSYKPTIEWIFNLVGGSLRNQGKLSVKPIYSWNLSGENAVLFCHIISPYLKEKKRQAEILIEYRKIGIFSRYDPPNEDQKNKREELRLECKGLKYVHY